MTANRLRFLGLTLIVLGLVVSAYLLFRHLALAGAGGGTDICSNLFGRSCDAALRSTLSTQLGLPLAGWGVVYYVTLGACLLLAWTLKGAFELEATIAASVLALLGALVSAGLFVMMMSGRSPFCPLCAILQGINLVLIFPIKRMTGRPFSQILRASVAGLKYVLTGKTDDPVLARWKLLAFFTVALVAVVMYQWVLIEARAREGSSNQAFDPQQVLAAFESSAEREIPVGAGDARRGPPDAPVQLVVFSDFQCPACRDFSHEMQHLAEQFEGQLTVIFKHYPLDRACNASMQTDLHPRACEAATAAEAARLQGKFWVFHDALFAADLNKDETSFPSIAEEFGLDVGRFEADRSAPAAMTKVIADIKLADRLGVDATPTVFLNGRYVSDNRPQGLQLLVERELQRASR